MDSPQAVSDHKRKWLMASYFASHVHSDYRSRVKDWCKANCFKWRYDIKTFTNVYEDTVRFELEEDFTGFNEWYKELIQ